MDINILIPLFVSLLGFPAIVAAGINALKYFSLVTDGQATEIVFWANIVGFVGVAIAYFTGNVPLLTQIDALLGDWALFIISFISFITQLGLAKIYHASLKGAPVIGTSFTLKEDQAQ
jgi:hypothetical protein